MLLGVSNFLYSTIMLTVLVGLAVAGGVSAADAQNVTFESSGTFCAGNDKPAGMWSDGTTMWVADSDDNKVYSNILSESNMSCDGTKDFNLASGNSAPRGMWSDGTTMWVADAFGTVYAYDMSTKTNIVPDGVKNFSPSQGNSPQGMWSDGTTMWVADYTTKKIYAYDISNKSNVTYKSLSLDLAAENGNPGGIWSDGTTMWVAGSAKDTIRAYNMSDKSRDESKDIRLSVFNSERNGNPYDIWSDGTTMWVADFSDGKIYSYKLPVSAGLLLRDFTDRDRNNFPDLQGSSQLLSGRSADGYLLDTTPPVVMGVKRTGDAITADHALTWEVTFSEPVLIRAGVYNNHTSVANATIPDLGAVRDTMSVDVHGMVTRGSVWMDIDHPITSGLLIELVAPDCTKFVIHNQTHTFLYKLRQPLDLGDIVGVGVVGHWALHVSDHAKYWNGTLNVWGLDLESNGVVEGGDIRYNITQYVAGPGRYTLSLDGYDIRDWAGNPLGDRDPLINEAYRVAGTAAQTCKIE